jgi:MFS family permease
MTIKSRPEKRKRGDRSISAPNKPRPRRTLTIASLAHALHDGYTDSIYVLLPIWQAEFGLSYSALALLRGLYAGVMALLQVPSGRLAERFGGRSVLVLGTILAAFGWMLAGISGSFVGLCAALCIGGAGSSTQHPIASAAVSRAYGATARAPLGVYNFMGDVGKAAVPALASLLIVIMAWRESSWVLAGIGIVVAAAIAALMPSIGRGAFLAPPGQTSAKRPRKGFWLLLIISGLDISVRAGFLTFLPFLLQEKGAVLSTVGIAFASVFIGGAFGKLVLGWIGARVRLLWVLVLTKVATAAGIVVVMVLPLAPSLIVLPLLGIALNGTSSVLYGTVPDVTPRDQTHERAFAIFYTGVIGAGAVAPVLYGLLADVTGVTWASLATAFVALLICPLSVALVMVLAQFADEPEPRLSR